MSAKRAEADVAHVSHFGAFLRSYLENRSDAGVQAFFDSIPDAVVVVDARGRIAFVNSQVLPLFGYEGAELLGSPIETLLPDDLRERHLGLVSHYLEHDRKPRMMGRNLNLSARHKDGNSLPVDISLSPIEFEGTIYVLAAVRDIHDQVLAREAARAERERLRSAMDSMLDPQVLLETVRDESGRIVDFVYTDANPAACTYNGLEYQDLVGARLLDLLPGHTSSGLLESYRQVVETGDPLVLDDFVYAQELLGGGQRHYDVRAVRVGDGLSYTWRDVTDRNVHAAALAASEQRYRMLAENSTDVVWQLDSDDIMRWVSPSIEYLLGWRPEQLLGTSVLEFVHPADQQARANWRAALYSGGGVANLESRRLAADGSYRWMSLQGRPIVDIDGSISGLVVGLRDIQQEVEMRAEVVYAMEHDPLTGLATVPVTLGRIDRLLGELAKLGPGRKVGVLRIGVDSLKSVNEALTHAAGDRVLEIIAARITEVAGSSDLLARGSGDEFVMLLPELTSGADAGAIAEQVRRAVKGPVTIGSHSFEPTVSIGIATGSRGAKADELLRDAALAMNQAKLNGRDRCEFFETHLAQEAVHLLGIETKIRQGLLDGQFVPWFQPIVKLVDRTLVGYEALVRWVQSDGTVVEPADFLSVAERTNLITDLDLVVFEQSVAALRNLPTPLYIACNLSAATLASNTYANRVVQVLADSGVDPARLHLEFTETALLKVTDHVREVMSELAGIGVRWYVDDFGTGYSSIAHLRDLPIAGLKLDLSFTAELGADDLTSERLALALVGLADGLGLDTVAEGVETHEQAAILRAQGWENGQGWLYGRPARLP